MRHNDTTQEFEWIDAVDDEEIVNYVHPDDQFEVVKWNGNERTNERTDNNKKGNQNWYPL